MRTSLKTAATAALAGCLGILTARAGAIRSEPFGQTPSGQPVQIYTLQSDTGIEARITNYGGIIVSLKVPDKDGRADDIVMGFDKLDGYLTPAYLKAKPFFGALIGRYANRINKGRFSLDGKEFQLSINNAPNTLHGGARGFDQRVWQAREVEGTVPTLELTYESADGEEGFPGKLSVKAVYTLEGSTLKLVFTATTDKPTVVNLTNHSYFNLKGAGNGDVLDHAMQIAADAYTPIDADSIPLPGGPTPVRGTPFDFTRPTKIGAHIEADDAQLKNGLGYDHNFVLRAWASGGEAKLIATVTEPTTGRQLELYSNQPGVQLYTGNFLDGTITGKGGRAYPHRGAFCLEPQRFPDTPNRPDFPSAVLRPGETYEHTIMYRFVVVK